MSSPLIQQIHATPGLWVTAITGGGSAAVSRLLAVPGASRTLVEATVPYHNKALAAYLGHTPAQACSAATARALAMAAFRRCQQLLQVNASTAKTEAALESPLFGLGCSAALTTDRSRRGQDRCFVAVQSLAASWELSLHLQAPGASREAQEALCSELVIAAMQCAQSSPVLDLENLAGLLPSLTAEDQLSARCEIAPLPWQALFNGSAASTWAGPERLQGVFPGAFNPLHAGHRAMVAFAKAELGHDVVLEISAFNVDKPPLDYLDMRARQTGAADQALVFSNTPTFAEKSAIFPGATFVVGSDTIERIADPRYYGGLTANRDDALALLQQRGHRFLVFGRSDGQRFIGLEQLALPASLATICDGVPESKFRIDVASRDLRQQARQ
jgi:nicotinamide mononucleotide (NMN) deamidase PncC